MDIAWANEVERALSSATVTQAFEQTTAVVDSAEWHATFVRCRDEVGLTFFDWLSAVDETGGQFTVLARVYDIASARGLVVSTSVAEDVFAPASIASITDIYAGASWHERETHEMFGIDFAGHGNLSPLLLPDAFDGHPLRKDFVLASRVAKAWPGAKDPAESGKGSPARRKTLPPGVPDPSEWGPDANRVVDDA